MPSLEQQVKDHAMQLGFDLVGIASASDSQTYPEFLNWLANDYAGEMHYMHQHAQARQHPQSILNNVRSIVMVALNYHHRSEEKLPENHGRVARYARGQDYHEVMRAKLNQLLTSVQTFIPNCQGRGVVDTAPLLERDFARQAGMGWYGKNTMLLSKHLGSYFLLGALLLDQELQADAPHASSHCGTCTACLRACPTEAFPEPGVLDSRKCISYLTIELRDAIPMNLRNDLGDWLFGCDICQEVCPWNRKAPLAGNIPILDRPELATVDLLELLQLSEEEFRRRFRGTPLFRTKRKGVLRNAAIVLGNIGTSSAIPILTSTTNDPEPLIREAAIWAIEQIRSRYPQSQ